MGPEGEDSNEDIMQPQRQRKRKGTKRKRTNDDVPCVHCGIPGHSRTNHFECLKNKKRIQAMRDECLNNKKRVQAMRDAEVVGK